MLPSQLCCVRPAANQGIAITAARWRGCCDNAIIINCRVKQSLPTTPPLPAPDRPHSAPQHSRLVAGVLSNTSLYSYNLRINGDREGRWEEDIKQRNRRMSSRSALVPMPSWSLTSLPTQPTPGRRAMSAGWSGWAGGVCVQIDTRVVSSAQLPTTVSICRQPGNRPGQLSRAPPRTCCARVMDNWPVSAGGQRAGN